MEGITRKFTIATILILLVTLVSMDFDITGNVSTSQKPSLSAKIVKSPGTSTLVISVYPSEKPHKRYINLDGPRRISVLTKCDDAGTKPGKSDCKNEVAEINLVTLPSGVYTATLRDPSDRSINPKITVRVP